MILFGLSRNKKIALTVTLFFLTILFYTAITWDFKEINMLSSDQINLTTAALSRMDIGLYSKDYFFMSDKYFRFYTPFYLKTLSYLFQLTGSPVNTYRFMFPIIILVYIISAFTFFMYLTKNSIISSLIAIFSSSYYFQIYSIKPTMLYLSFVFFLLYLFFKWTNEENLLILFFLIVGLSANIHPVSGGLLFLFCLASKSIFDIVEGKFTFSKIHYYLLFTASFCIGAAPFILNYVRNSGPIAQTQDASIINSMIKYRLNPRFTQFSIKNILLRFLTGYKYYFETVSFLFPIFYIGVTARLIMKKFGRNDLLLCILFVVAALFSNLGQFVIIKGSELFNIVYPLIDILRGEYLVSFIIIAYSVLLVSSLIELVNEKKAQWKYPLKITVISLITILLCAQGYAFTVNNMKMYTRIKKYTNLGESQAGVLRAIEELSKWARENTSQDSLFHFFRPNSSAWKFRCLARRSVTVTKKEGGFFCIGNKDKIFTWYEKVRACRPPFGKGINVIEVDSQKGVPVRYSSFKPGSAAGREDPSSLVEFIKGMKDGNIILMSSSPDISGNLSEVEKLALQTLGLDEALKIGPEDLWVFISVAGENRALAEKIAGKGTHKAIFVEAQYMDINYKVLSSPEAEDVFEVGFVINETPINRYYAVEAAKGFKADYVVIKGRFEKFTSLYSNERFSLYPADIFE